MKPYESASFKTLPAPVPPTRGSRWRPEFALALASMASGAALVAAILTKLSLALTLLILGTFAVVVVSFRWTISPPVVRRAIGAQFRTGVVAGIPATIAYDACRFLVVQVARLPIRPFETLGIFGHLILGQSAATSPAIIVGTVYHYLNGISFAIAYCFVFGGRNWKLGVAWALGLEAAMLAIYPGWLDLRLVMKEFTVVSFAGHLAFGSTLGVISQRCLAMRRLPDATTVGRALLPEWWRERKR